jgi:aspartyl-tRNA(Asn)/glutamyl-tRNA(Gln) amidotransferase subunit C
MSLSKEETHKIAKLARIRITDDEAEKYSHELSSILDWIEMLGEVDTGDEKLVASVVEHPLPLRKDEVTAGGEPERILANAPAKEYDCFVVPKVIDS